MAAPLRVLIPFGTAVLCFGLATAGRSPSASSRSGCGPTSLHALCRHFGVAATLDDIYRISGADFPTSSLSEMKNAARALGLKAEGLQMSIPELRRTKPLGILHIDGGHFVALIGYTNAGPRVADPVAQGKTWASVWPYARLSARWDGRILVVTP